MAMIHRVVGDDSIGNEIVVGPLNFKVVGFLHSHEFNIDHFHQAGRGQLVPGHSGTLDPLGLDRGPSEFSDEINFPSLDCSVAIHTQGREIGFLACQTLIGPDRNDMVAVQLIRPLVAQLAGPPVEFVDFGGNLGCPPTNTLTIGGDTPSPEIRGRATAGFPNGFPVFRGHNHAAVFVCLSLVPGFLGAAAFGMLDSVDSDPLADGVATVVRDILDLPLFNIVLVIQPFPVHVSGGLFKGQPVHVKEHVTPIPDGGLLTFFKVHRFLES